jgi:hypothetical protein
VGLDNPNAPTRADCTEPGCPKKLVIPDNHSRRDTERDLNDNGWSWEAEYETVHAYCPEHSTEPVRKNRGSKR